MFGFLVESINNMKRTEVSVTHHEHINNRMLHAIIGIADESGELVEMMLRSTFYNKPINITDYKDELGDLWWYICLAVDDLAKQENKKPAEIFREILDINKAKLLIRYPEGYSDKQALDRNLKKENDAVHHVEGAS